MNHLLCVFLLGFVFVRVFMCERVSCLIDCVMLNGLWCLCVVLCVCVFVFVNVCGLFAVYCVTLAELCLCALYVNHCAVLAEVGLCVFGSKCLCLCVLLGVRVSCV